MMEKPLVSRCLLGHRFHDGGAHGPGRGGHPPAAAGRMRPHRALCPEAAGGRADATPAGGNSGGQGGVVLDGRLRC